MGVGGPAGFRWSRGLVGGVSGCSTVDRKVGAGVESGLGKGVQKGV
jgi:hypothetical protein